LIDAQRANSKFSTFLPEIFLPFEIFAVNFSRGGLHPYQYPLSDTKYINIMGIQR